MQYNLLSEFTSFVAVDYETVNKNGAQKRIKQPLSTTHKTFEVAVGAEAEIKGKSAYKKSFKINISTSIHKSNQRAIKMWIKSNYSDIIKMYLKKYKQIKIHLNQKGEIIKIEKQKNNTWVIGSQLKKHIQKLPTNLTNNKNLVITLKQ